MSASSMPKPMEPHGNIEKKAYRTSCDSCKRMKTKCDRQGNTCTRCIARGTECVLTLVRRKEREKKSHYVSAIESRMSRMENVMMASGLSLDHDDPSTEPKTGITHVNTQSQLSNALSMQVVTGNGCSSFLGISSGFSIFSPEGLKWVSEKIGGDYFGNLLKIVSESHNSVTEIPGPNLWHFRRFEEHHPLPPVELAVKFIDEFFHTLNSTFPLYNQDLFRENYARVPFPTPASDTAWYASLNIVIGIGQIIHMKGLAPDATSLALIQNAASTYVDLVSKHPSLDAVQALLGMTILMQAAEESHAAYFLSTSAARIAQSMGLHQKLSASTTKPKQIETRNNVFWICYIIDKGMSLRHGRPSIIHDEDIGVELPDKGSEIFNPSQHLRFYAFYYMSTLALLESRIYSQLYSVRSRTQSKLQRLKTVGNLDHELQTWLETVPVEIRPGQEILCDERDVNVVILVYFAFYNCLIAIHRESAYHGSWTKEGETRMLSKARSQGFNTRVYESAKICLDAARNVIKLLRHYRADAGFPSVGLISMANWYPLTAALTLFANILQTPTAPTARTDLALMTSVADIFSQVPHSLSAGINSLAHPGRPELRKLAGLAFREITRLAAACIEKETLGSVVVHHPNFFTSTGISSRYNPKERLTSESQKAPGPVPNLLDSVQEALHEIDTVYPAAYPASSVGNGALASQKVSNGMEDSSSSGLDYFSHPQNNVNVHTTLFERSVTGSFPQQAGLLGLGDMSEMVLDEIDRIPFVPQIFQWDMAGSYMPHEDMWPYDGT